MLHQVQALVGVTALVVVPALDFDEVVADDAVLEVAVAQAIEFAALSLKAYAVTIRKMRGKTVATMAEQIAADRSGGVGAPL